MTRPEIPKDYEKFKATGSGTQTPYAASVLRGGQGLVGADIFPEIEDSVVLTTVDIDGVEVEALTPQVVDGLFVGFDKRDAIDGLLSEHFRIGE